MATLLIVEDDALLLDALSGQLKQLDYSVCTASSVPQAMALLQMQAVDGIILDLGLPGADGIELLTWARAHIAGLPVLILTARDGVEDRVQGLNAGVIGTELPNQLFCHPAGRAIGGDGDTGLI